MSQSAMQEITCPKCGKKTSFLVWDNVEAHYKDKKIDEIYFATNDDGVHGFLFRRAGEMVASMEFDESLYKAIYDSAYERLDAATRNDLYIDRDWAKDVVERMG